MYIFYLLKETRKANNDTCLTVHFQQLLRAKTKKKTTQDNFLKQLVVSGLMLYLTTFCPLMFYANLANTVSF